MDSRIGAVADRVLVGETHAQTSGMTVIRISAEIIEVRCMAMLFVLLVKT